jgi:MFS family permease
MAYGYDTIANGAALSMPAFLLYWGEINPETGAAFLPSVWASLWTAMSALAQAFGSLTIGYLADRFGRKWSTVAAGLITIAGTAIQYTSTARGVLTVGKMINGFAIGAMLSSAMTYASEVAPQAIRSQVQSVLVLFTISMQAVGLGIVRAFVPDLAPQAFRNIFAVQWAVGGLVIIAFSVVPE